jgi:hypothetical protein
MIGKVRTKSYDISYIEIRSNEKFLGTQEKIAHNLGIIISSINPDYLLMRIEDN